MLDEHRCLSLVGGVYAFQSSLYLGMELWARANVDEARREFQEFKGVLLCSEEGLVGAQ